MNVKIEEKDKNQLLFQVLSVQGPRTLEDSIRRKFLPNFLGLGRMEKEGQTLGSQRHALMRWPLLRQPPQDFAAHAIARIDIVIEIDIDDWETIEPFHGFKPHLKA